MDIEKINQYFTKRLVKLTKIVEIPCCVQEFSDRWEVRHYHHVNVEDQDPEITENLRIKYPKMPADCNNILMVWVWCSNPSKPHYRLQYPSN